MALRILQVDRLSYRQNTYFRLAIRVLSSFPVDHFIRKLIYIQTIVSAYQMVTSNALTLSADVSIPNTSIRMKF